MPKNRNAAASFNLDHVSLLIDTSSIVRIRNFSEVIPQYAQLFDLYTLEKNKTELTFLADDPVKTDIMMFYTLELINQIRLGNVKMLKNGAPNVAMPRSFDRNVCKLFPNNELSYTDKLLLFFADSAKDNVILVTNDRELRIVAERIGIVSFGAYELYCIKDKIKSAPKSIKEILPIVIETNQLVGNTYHS